MTRLTQDDPINETNKHQGHLHLHLVSTVLEQCDSDRNSHVECRCGMTGVMYRGANVVWNNECRYGYGDCNAVDGYCEQCQKEHNY